MAPELTGLWHGRYSYPHDVADVAFTAVLTESGGPFTGVVEEVDADEGALSASVEGRRAGSAVTFAKFYDTGSERFDTVFYEGVLSPDNNEIEGVWRNPGAPSGRFLMIRSEPPAVAAERREAVEIVANGRP